MGPACVSKVETALYVQAIAQDTVRVPIAPVSAMLAIMDLIARVREWKDLLRQLVWATARAMARVTMEHVRVIWAGLQTIARWRRMMGVETVPTVAQDTVHAQKIQFASVM